MPQRQNARGCRAHVEKPVPPAFRPMVECGDFENGESAPAAGAEFREQRLFDREIIHRDAMHIGNPHGSRSSSTRR